VAATTKRTGIETLHDIALLRFRTALSSAAPRQYCDSNPCLSWTDLSEDSREIIKALVHGVYRGPTRLRTRITEDARHLAASHESGAGPNPPDRVTGRARQLCPRTSDVDFLGDLKRIVDLNAEVAYGAFDPRVAE
jgi:hypothetical protein